MWAEISKQKKAAWELFWVVRSMCRQAQTDTQGATDIYPANRRGRQGGTIQSWRNYRTFSIQFLETHFVYSKYLKALFVTFMRHHCWKSLKRCPSIQFVFSSISWRTSQHSLTQCPAKVKVTQKPKVTTLAPATVSQTTVLYKVLTVDKVKVTQKLKSVLAPAVESDYWSISRPRAQTVCFRSQ